MIGFFFDSEFKPMRLVAGQRRSKQFSAYRNRIVFLVLAFLAIPYSVDVAFYGDLTPTHYAQIYSNQEDPESNTDCSTTVFDLVVVRLPLQWHLNGISYCSIDSVCVFEFILSPTVISRPPPLVPIA